MVYRLRSLADLETTMRTSIHLFALLGTTLALGACTTKSDDDDHVMEYHLHSSSAATQNEAYLAGY